VCTGLDRTQLARRIHATAHLTGTFRLRSGQVSDEYFDKYLFESDPALLRDVGRALAFPLPDRTETVAGLELGGIPLATVVSQISGLPTLFVRKEAKTYGTCRLAEGGEVAGRRLAVVEDVVTSGGQLLKSCADLRERGAEIEAVLCVIDRQQGGRDALTAAGLKFRAVFTMDDLVAATA
jgi:orotate phosphoribosyltransferase